MLCRSGNLIPADRGDFNAIQLFEHHSVNFWGKQCGRGKNEAEALRIRRSPLSSHNSRSLTIA